MKKIIRTSALVLAMTLLCGCASEEARKVEIYTGKYPINIESEQTAPITEITAPTEPAITTNSTEATEATEAADPDKVTETAEPVEYIPEETAEPDTIETQSEESTLEADGEITQEEIAEQLDLFYRNEFGAYQLTDEERSFTNDSIFVGDSICRGFSVYNVVSSKNVYACGSLAARSFFDYNFYYGDDEVNYKTVLKKTKPKYVFLSMGMNDINITDEDEFCENYRTLIDYTLKRTEGVVYVCAITPVDSEFTTNYRIDCFNLALQDFIEENYSERVFYVDFAKHLKDKSGKLRIIHSSGDGIHLGPYAYYIALWEINRTMILDGNWTPPESLEE